MKIKKLVASIMAIATISTCAFAAVGCKEKETEKETAYTQQGGAVIMDGESNGISFMSTTIAQEDYDEYGVSATAESAQLLTATVTPSYATQAEVVWSVSFLGVDTTWSNGKTVTDYVTVVPAGSNSQTATVTCLQAFGDVIEVKAALKTNSAINATSDIHYFQRVTGLKTMLFPDNYVIGGAVEAVGAASKIGLDIDYEEIDVSFENYIYSMSTQSLQWYESEVYTDEADLLFDIKMTLTREFISALESAGFTFDYVPGEEFDVKYIGNWALNALDDTSFNAFERDERGEIEAWSTAIQALGDGKEIGSVHIYVSHESRDDRVPDSIERQFDFQENYPIIINANSYNVYATGISLSSSTLYF